ncbi:aspartate aminotransferase family protein [Fervidobacterium thailandense]|uniref:Aminotransferase class III n=1 Tax=Fervidobacterium thailandense TaxID=1008305 RepID=A0A1E3G2H4_9BACT|nr:aminotransferase class III-fold pyridoxal phosphate-dependent enzyme [Fervidobacterium thailandense]ODN30427.1 aminotransferase class III [Fervidobacterium thailandense]
MSYLADTYVRFPIKVRNALGIKIWDIDGNEYIDTFMGIGVLLFGHNHPGVVQAMKEKIERYVHLSNFFLDEDAEHVARRLISETGKNGKVFFTNSGTESTECALKVIAKFRKKYKQKGKILSFVRNFHGRTSGALRVTGFEKIRTPFLEEDTEVVFLPYDVSEVEEFLKSKLVDAVFLEVVHGSGGLDAIPVEIVEVIKFYQKERGFILVADEVQSGLGRTGKFYAYQHYDLDPDIVTVAKGIGGGLPLGACLMLGQLADVFETGEHGSTFAPNPVALAAGRVILQMITPELLEHVTRMGEVFQKTFSKFGTVRGLGLMRGVELEKPVTKDEFLSEGLLVNIVGERILRFLLPLNVSEDEISEIAQRLGRVLQG